MKSQKTLNLEDFTPLERFNYPKSIKFLCILIGICGLIYTPFFIISHLPLHLKVHKEILEAENLFQNKEFEKSITHFRNILLQNPTCKFIRVRLAEAHFRLSEKNKDHYYIALSYLTDNYSDKTVAELKKYVPSQYQHDFDALWKKVAK